VALRNLAVRLVELGFDLGGQPKLVFQELVNPRTQVFDLGAGQSRNGRFNVLDSAHGGKIRGGLQIGKSKLANRAAVIPSGVRRPVDILLE